MDGRKQSAIVIGGGIAGPAAALFLRRAGIASTVYEAHPCAATIGGALGIAPNGMKVLASLRLDATLTTRGAIISRYEFRNAQGRLLAGFSPFNAAEFGESMVAVSRAALQDVLLDEMTAQGIPVHYGKRLVGVDQRADRVIAHFADGMSAEADLLIGADGVKSAVRSVVFPDAPLPAYTGLVGIGGFAPIAAAPELAHSNVMTFTYGRHGFFGYAPLDANRAMWWSNLFRDREFSAAEIRAPDWPLWREELLNRFRDYGAPVCALMENTSNALRINVYDIQSLPTWHRGRVLLIGDAAHTVSPNAGQGASLALEDAQYLAKVLSDSSDHARAFARFEQDRKPRAERVVAEGRRRGADKAIVGPFKQKLREMFLGAILRRYGATADRWMFEYEIH